MVTVPRTPQDPELAALSALREKGSGNMDAGKRCNCALDLVPSFITGPGSCQSLLNRVVGWRGFLNLCIGVLSSSCVIWALGLWHLAN